MMKVGILLAWKTARDGMAGRVRRRRERVDWGCGSCGDGVVDCFVLPLPSLHMRYKFE
jgi:hypothetical protein